jgi:hypothetical protein
MTNVQASLNGTILTLTVDLAQRHGLSKSEKTTIVASTHGPSKLAGPNDDISVNLNVYSSKL